MDFEGITLRRKFLTGLEPESIHMTIGENVFGLSFVSDQLLQLLGQNVSAQGHELFS